MADIFSLENGIVKPVVETLLISPFKDIWDRDKSKDKTVAIKEFGYIEFMTSLKKSNPYLGYNEKERPSKIIEGLGLPKDWVADELVLSGISKIEEFNTEGSSNYLAYKDSMEALNTTRSFLKNIDLSERTKSGLPVYKPSDVYSAIERVEKAVISLNNLKEKVLQDLFDSSRIRGNKTVSALED